MVSESKKERVAALLRKGVLISPDFLGKGEHVVPEDSGLVVLNEESSALLSRNDARINWREFEKVRVLFEKGKASLPSVDDISPASEEKASDFEVVASYKSDPQKVNVSHFAAYFNKRYRLIEGILRSRPELQNLTSIGRLKGRSISNNLSIIGMVSNKSETKNRNILLLIEDLTGQQRVVINRNRNDLFSEARDIVLDEVIGISGSYREGMFFANNLVFPDIPSMDVKRSPDEEYLACMSDLHFGSRQFMSDEVRRFLSWVNLETGSDKQKRVAEKLKYIIIAGDIADGIGIYNNQFEELAVPDLKKQYEAFSEFLSQIPPHIRVVVSPGNHDAVRMAEPQPPLANQFTGSLSRFRNVSLVSNPAVVRIGIKENFSGFNCLVYHGYSFDHYVANVDSIRQNGGYERADLIMKFLLKRRHLAPTHASTLINPTPDYDSLFINPVPDFFITGHIHRTSVSGYKSVTLINSSCWQSMTSFQERLGHNPQPARLPIVNLKTRDASIIKF